MKIAFDSLLSATAAPNTDDNGSTQVDLWSQLPSELAALFRPSMQDLVGDILDEIRATIPALAQPAESVVGKKIIEGIQQAILQFLDRLADPSRPQDDRARLFREMGVLDLYDGPILDVLQATYRVGARVAWRHIAQVGERAGVPTTTLCLLAEAIFAYIDELSALSVEGQASAKAKALGTMERRRRQLLGTLLSADGDPKRLPLPRLAESAKWPVPERVVVVALELCDATEDRPVPSVDSRFLIDLESAEPCLIAAEDALDALRQLPVDLPGWRAAVGPAVAPQDAAESMRWARRMVTLIGKGVLPEAPLTWFDQHMSALWLLNDTFLVNQIADRALAPMDGLTSKQRDKLSETLLMWLETRGSAPEIAVMLDVHPQTVRYRLRQLDRIFGKRLTNADSRFELEIALRSQRTTHDPSDDD